MQTKKTDYLCRVLEEPDDDVAPVATQLPLGLRGLVQGEHPAFALHARRNPVGVLAVRAGGVGARVAARVLQIMITAGLLAVSSTIILQSFVPRFFTFFMSAKGGLL